MLAIAGVDRTKTKANAVDGLAQFTVFFEFSKPVAEASQDVRDAIAAIRDDLPTEMKEPIITRFDPAQQSLLSLSLASPTMSPEALTRVADPIVVRALRSVPASPRSTVVGGSYPEMTVQIRPAAMQAAGVGVDAIVAAVGQQNLAAPVGRLNGALEERSIRLKGRLSRCRGVPAAGGHQPQRHADPARRRGRRLRGQRGAADRCELQRQAGGRHRGQEGEGLLDHRGGGPRSRWRRRASRARCPATRRSSIVRDQGFRVERAVANVQSALIEGAVLTVLVVFLFLNSWRSTVITGLALPVSVLASFIAVWAFGFTLNTMSLLGLSLAIGILIDDAIVVRENIVRHIEMGKDHITASREGTAEIGLAVAATTFSIVAVFVPIAFMSGQSGQWFKPFALTIACAVLVSLFVSFSLDPMLSAYWADPHQEEHEKGADHPDARQVQSLVRPDDGALRAGGRLGARPSLVDGAAWPSSRSSALWCSRGRSAASASCRWPIGRSSK